MQSKDKHFINTNESIVADSLQGLCYASPHLRWLPNSKVVYAANIDKVAKQQVTLISGGGSGHEPGHAGSVGKGMLSAAVCGHVFASPSASQVFAAIERVQSPHGTLVIVMNYTGDCLNFGLAVERAKAKGIKVDMVIVGDDIASGGKNHKVGRRGMSGTTLVIKIAGALASRGATLEQVIAMAKRVANNSATLGVALDHCHVPGASAMHLQANELEIGMGIHNETGLYKAPIKPAKNLVEEMIAMLLNENDRAPSCAFSSSPNQTMRIVLLVNNYGSTPVIELGIVAKEAVEALLRRNHIQLERVLCGSFLTSLDMPGVSLTLLRIDDDDVLSLLDAPVLVSGWPLAPAHSFCPQISEPSSVTHEPLATVPIQSNVDLSQNPLARAIQAAAQAVIDAEPKVTELDTILGDGDCGQTLKSGAQGKVTIRKEIIQTMVAVLDRLPTFPLESAPDTMLALTYTINHAVGGTSSAIYCIFLNALAASLRRHGDWKIGVKEALDALQCYTKARVGDRTLMDCLIPFVTTLQSPNTTLHDAIAAAQKGTEDTIGMSASLGRTSYLSQSDVQSSHLPDPGAWGLLALLSALDK